MDIKTLKEEKTDDFLCQENPISFFLSLRKYKSHLETLLALSDTCLQTLLTLNLKKALRDKPVGVHFSMHGKNITKKSTTKKAYSNFVGFEKDSGYFLLFEQENSTAAFFQARKVKDKLFVFTKEVCMNINFVVITSCESKNLGRCIYE